MKKLILALWACLLTFHAFSQAPQAINYQAVARDKSGILLSSKSITMRMSILSGSASGSSVYEETFGVKTNSLGLFSIQIGKGSVVSGDFSKIDWSANSYFLQVEMKDSGASAYSLMGTSQMVSVPFALYANKAGNATTYKAGNGINISNDSIINSATDKTVIMKGSGATSVSGAYPNFTITSTDSNTKYHSGSGIKVSNDSIINIARDQIVSLKGTGGTNISGTYPSFTVDSKVYKAGTGIKLSNDSIINTSPDQKVTLTGSGTTAITGSYPNFSVSSSDSTMWKRSGSHDIYYKGGNVGIGYIRPSARLTIDSGNLEIGSFNPGQNGIVKNVTVNKPGQDGSLVLGMDVGYSTIELHHKYDSVSKFSDFYTTFNTTKGGVNAGERMRITPIGNVGIGTSSPYGKLDVASGNIYTSIHGNDTSGHDTSNRGTTRIGMSTAGLTKGSGCGPAFSGMELTTEAYSCGNGSLIKFITWGCNAGCSREIARFDELGYFGINAKGTSTKVFIVGTTSSNGNGAYLSAGGTWTNASDINLKENITSLEAKDILNKISKLNINRWMYKGTNNEYHIGPMAQDFYSAFNVGVNNTSISSIDPAGVALIGIQELAKENADLKAKNAELEHRLLEVEKALNLSK
jgi:hypothetical protein